MSAPRTMRIVISCVTFETAMVTEPIEYYKADKAYLIHKALDKPFIDFLEKIKADLDEMGVPHEEIQEEIFRFPNIMKRLVHLIREEKEKNNIVYVNITSGPPMYSAAALLAALMEGGEPFNVGVQEFMVKSPELYDIFYKTDEETGKKTPVGTAVHVYPPFWFPEFDIKAPDPDLVKALNIWKKAKEGGAIMSASNIAKKLAAEGMIKKLYKTKKDEERGKVSQNAIMEYRRNYLEPWLAEKWMEKGKRGEYEMTEKGKNIAEIFG